MDFKDYYKVLGLAPGADDQAVKKAYRKLARKFHPDVSQEKDAENIFKQVVEAYEALKSAEKRAEYAALNQHAQRGQPFEPASGWQPPGNKGYADGAEFNDLFESLFKGGGQFKRPGSGSSRGQDIEMALSLVLEETLADEARQIAFQLPQYSPEGLPMPAIRKTLNVKVPAGVSDGERIRIKGQGAPGMGGGANGDLYLIIHLVPHPLFDVEAHNLILTVPLAPWEAALGSQITVPTLSGKISLRIPANTQSGQRLRIKAKGLLNKSGEPGDLYALFKIVIPTQADAPVRALWAQLAEQAAFDPRAQWSS